MLTEHVIRFFVTCYIHWDLDDIEIDEATFIELQNKHDGRIEYHRNAVFKNGAKQVCLTFNPSDLKSFDELNIKALREEDVGKS